MPGEWKPDASDAARAAQIREELRDILASEAFRGGKRAQDFFQLIVEHALAERFDNLRERMLGAEMFGRPVGYDTANDAVVRVKASEVRRRLTQYYQSLTRQPAVRIDLPAGSYVPRFSFAEVEDLPEQLAATDQPIAVPAPEELKGTIPPPTPPVRPAIFRRAAALAVAVMILAGFACWFIWSRMQSNRVIQSIAILPLENLSGDPSQDYFADGMTEELITELGQVASLRVISRTSTMTYKGTRKTIPEIANELHVDAIVEGSVARDGKHVRITTQLIDARTDRHLWSRTYDRDMTGVLELQSEVAREIVDQIRAEVTPAEKARLDRSQRVDPEALELYLQGMQKINTGAWRDSIVYFRQSIEKDPDYAAAHAGLANAYGWEGESGDMSYAEAFTQQKAEALKAIQLDDSRPEPHLDLAFAALDQSWDWTTAGRELERALALSPNSTSVHWAYANFLIRTGRPQEAGAEADVALQLDPVSSRSYMERAFIDYYARRYDAALAELQSAATLEHNATVLLFPLGAVYTEKAMYPEAIREFQEQGGAHALGHMGNIYARQGQRQEAIAIAESLKQTVAKSGIGRYEIALIYAGLGDKDNAFAWLGQAFNARDKGMLFLKIDPCLDPLRSDPRFADLLKRVGFPT